MTLSRKNNPDMVSVPMMTTAGGQWFDLMKAFIYREREFQLGTDY